MVLMRWVRGTVSDNEQQGLAVTGRRSRCGGSTSSTSRSVCYGGVWVLLQRRVR